MKMLYNYTYILYIYRYTIDIQLDTNSKMWTPFEQKYTGYMSNPIPNHVKESQQGGQMINYPMIHGQPRQMMYPPPQPRQMIIPVVNQLHHNMNSIRYQVNPSMNVVGPPLQQGPMMRHFVNYIHHVNPYVNFLVDRRPLQQHNVMTSQESDIQRQYRDASYYMKHQVVSLQVKDNTSSDTTSSDTTSSSFDSSTVNTTTSTATCGATSSATSNTDNTSTTNLSSVSSSTNVLCDKCNSLNKRTKMFYLKTKNKLYCMKCFEPGMKGLHGAFCHEFCNNNCDKKATWGYPGQGNVLTCRTHRLNGMINVNVKNCHFIDKTTKTRCKNEALYALKSNKNKRLYCELHCHTDNTVFVRKRCNKKKRDIKKKKELHK